MSQANVEIVHAVYRAAARRDRDAVLALYDPAVEWDVSDSPMARLVGGGVHHGHDGLLQFFRKAGKIIRVVWFPTRLAALAAAGLPD